MNMRKKLLGGVGVLLGGCSLDAPYSLNFSLESTTTGVSNTVAYRVSEGATQGSSGAVQEQTSVLGVGVSCEQAKLASGSYSSDTTYEETRVYSVVGESEMDLPLVPGEPRRRGMYRWKPTAVSLVSDTRETSSVSTIVEDVATVDTATGQVSYREDVRYVDGDVTTLASYFAVAADEYLVQVALDQLWEEQEDFEPSDLTLLTKWKPKLGDAWPSVNGNFLFIFEGTEDLNLAGVEMKDAAKIAVLETATFASADGAEVFETCLKIGRNDLESSDPVVGDVSADRAILDPGCEGSFTHVRSGTEWWWKGALVQSEGTDIIVEIADYGFEWFVLDENVGNCTRLTSTTRDDPSASAFIEYRVTTDVRSQAVTSLVE